jgi:hypothetical protein
MLRQNGGLWVRSHVCMLSELHMDVLFGDVVRAISYRGYFAIFTSGSWASLLIMSFGYSGYHCGSFGVTVLKTVRYLKFSVFSLE